ncbi:hypothetical protein DBR11_21495 [Pedobacter sp. HMWF019]|uniref:PepSY-associated TM helix domain-containing protein n=1 Tax=Pedobacter sp. HMWF019 TaxID=2056856 RepID=UPI000D3B4B8B|nr:PepSY-associated TM helix domain-containing protein [Pedobacter sp. HMWF019]PTS95362.1 hypothetical protein DBR11_21495 [Pedobacter sp. HMWF019]
MTFKKVAHKIHLWLGFTAGLVLVINLLPASIFAFNKELQEWWYHSQVYADEVKATRLPVSKLRENAQTALGTSGHISGLQIINDANKTYVFGAFKANKTPGLTFFSEYEVYKQVYVNPYTGKVQGILDMKYNWIYLCRVMHQQMLLRYDIGHLFIGIASLILFLSLFTGLILWFPKNKAALKQRFSIKWNARWRRTNYDVHNVGGFYTFLLIFLLATSGLLWSFGWWATGFYRLLGADSNSMSGQYQNLPAVAKQWDNPLDHAFEEALQKRKTWTEMYVGFPDQEVAEKERTIAFYLSFNNGSGWDQGDEYQYKASTGTLSKQILQENKTVAVKWQGSNYGIHTGSIYGLPSKILMCLGTLFCASLPVTGFLIWWGRQKKKRKK